MKKSIVFAMLSTLILAACSSNPVTKRSPPAPAEQTTSDQTSGGGYYPGDGPHANPPSNLDDIPDATPKKEALYKYSTKPYIALGKKYTPLQSADNYKKQGVASWYGKLFHGNKTANGEVYDMYSMTAAHTVLPLPSYAKVTNLENGRSVIVRINDRGPFKHDREIDLSYAAAYKLRLIEKGSGLVEVEAIDPDTFNQAEQLAQAQIAVPTPQPATESQLVGQHYVQAGAFGEESNATALQKRIQTLNIEENAKINRVYNNGLHRLLIGPYQTRQAAELAADNIRNNLNISTIITIQ